MFRRNPFTTAQRTVTLPGGTGDPLLVGKTLGTQFRGYRVEGVVIPFMYVGCKLQSGEIELNFLDDDGQPFEVSDAVRNHAGALAAEMASHFIEAYPDYAIETVLYGRDPDPLPRYRDGNDDPWMGFTDCDVVERVNTDIGEIVVGSHGMFGIRVGAGTDYGVPALRIDGKPYAFRHDYVVEDGIVEPDDWLGQPVPLHAYIDMPKPSFEKLGFELALKRRKVGDKAPQQVSDTVARVSRQVAQDFLERRFNDIRQPVVRMFKARIRAVEQVQAILRSGIQFASPAIQDFHRRRLSDLSQIHETYQNMVDDLQAMTGPEQATTAKIGSDGHYEPLDESAPRPSP